MKLYVLTKTGSKTPERHWDNNPCVYSSRKEAKEQVAMDYGYQVREAELTIGKIVK